MDGNASATTRAEDQLGEGATVLGPTGGGILAVQQAADAMAAQSQQMANSAKQLLASAQSGGFGFQPEAADTLIEALQESIADLDGLQSSLEVISQAPKLGLTPAAQWVSPFTQWVATDGQGIVRAIDSLQQVLTDIIAAYQEAKKHYSETDTIAAQQMRRMHH
jgi:hypothetical protein